MQNIVNYQMSIFGEYMYYEPTLERMNALAKTPPELNLTLLPTTVNFIPLDGVIPQQGVITATKALQRIQMVDTGQQLSLVIMPDRIDVNFTQPNSEGAEQLDGLSARVLALLKHTISIVEAKYWRIAINMTIQTDDESGGAAITSLHNALAKPLSHQITKECVEWHIMSNCPQEIIFGAGNSEQMNVITTLSRQVNMATNTPCVITVLDVNTSAMNRTCRFGDSAMNEFYSSALKTVKSIISDIEEKWKNV